MKTPHLNRRILLIDDNPEIHEDFKKILMPQRSEQSDYFGVKTLLFGGVCAAQPRLQFEFDSAYQGRQGLEMIEQAARDGRHYAMAFVDVRMPPGWDGIETIARVWDKHPDLQIVICTAYSDYSWDDVQQRIGQSDSLLILKKPFDNVEVMQLAQALTSKWNATRAANMQIEQLDQAVAERTRELARSEERFAKAFRNNPLGMFIQTVDDERVVDANPAFLKLIGRTPEEVFGRALSELGLWPCPETKTTAAVLTPDYDVQTAPIQIRTRTGEERSVLRFAEQFDVGLEPCRLVLLQDVTERLKLEADLRQAHKMEAIGQLATGIAHDFNNMLSIIQGYISLVLSRNHLEDQTNHALIRALTASERAATLTRQLLEFSRKQVMARKPISLGFLFEQVEAMLDRIIGDQVQIEMECPDNLPLVFADHCNIEQVVINLAVNARDAMPDGGTLSIDAFEVRSDRSLAAPHEHSGNPSKSFVCIRVTDTGSGMDEPTKARIFEPFFTTKAVGKGTGMGLATVYGIVKQHQGWIELDSAPGQGTIFRIYLPVSFEIGDTPILSQASAPAGKATSDETILVVEDEQVLLDFLHDVLRSHGYRVLTAANAVEALKVWQRESNLIALLLTDMVMPNGVTGKQLADKLKGEKPALRVIYSSGYSLELAGENPLPQGVSLLHKPYQASVLVKTVRDCLDAQSDHTAQPGNS